MRVKEMATMVAVCVEARMPRWCIGVAGGVWLLVLAGCTMGPDYHLPDVNAPSQWQAQPTPGFIPADSEALKNGWQAFDDPVLDDLMYKALAGNLDVKIALARIAQARAERRGTRAELFPSVNAVAGAQRNENPFPGFAPGLRFNLFEVGFDALWEIDVFGRQQRRLEAASADLEAAGEQHHQVLLSLSADVARSYIDYRRLQQQLRITRDNLDTQHHTLQLTEKLFAEGVSARHDVVRSRAQVETTASQIPMLEAEMLAQLRRLEVLLGERPGSLDTALSVVAPLPQAPAQALLLSPAETLRQRPDVKAAERHLAAATAMQGAAIAELFPKISLSAFLGLRNTDIETLFKSAAFSYGTAANLMQPLLNWGRIQAGIDLAEARQQEAYLNYQKILLDALQDVETALTRYLKEDIRRQSLEKSVTDLQESLRLSRLRYQEGVSSLLEVLDAQRALHAVEIELSHAKANTSIHWIALYKAMGAGASGAYR